MKKILLFAFALAGLFLAGSCQKETLEPAAQGGVTYEITLPDGPQTKGELGYQNYDLHYEVYKTADANALATAPLLFEKTVTMEGNTHKLELDLLNDQDYTILFWANKQGENYFDLTNLRQVGVRQAASNNDDRDAFCGMDQLFQHDGAQSKTVELKRPFAQINIATLVPTVAGIGYDVTPTSSLVKVKNIPVKYNVFTGEPVGAAAEVEYTVNLIPKGNLTVNTTEYKKVAMNYALVPATQDNSATVEVYYEINTVNGTVKNSIPNVPVKKNYRTNIIGNLLTSNATYTIEVKPGFEGDNGAHVEVINEGVTKNINGDYEVSTAKGLAYAINNLWAEGGNFYLTAAEYDMTGLNVTAPTIPAGVTLNIYGETPVVTRAMTSIAGITIKGLDSIIETIADGANVSISGVELVDDGSVLVENNSGTLVVSESTGEENVVRNGNAPVEADKVKDLATLKAALASAVKTIDIAESFAVTEVVLVDRSVVINGNDKTFTTSANRAFRLTTSDIEVTFNNLDIVSTAVMIYPSDVRGVAIDANLSNVVLTLNDCTIDFTDETTNDWTYAVNVAGNGTGHKVTVNGGSYEGANVINVYGAKNVITVKNAVLNCLYPNNDLYYGSCIWVLQNQGSSVYAEGNTFNGSNAIAFNLGTGTALEEKDNVDNTQMIVAKSGETYFTSLAEAFDAVETEATIKVLQNTDMSAVTVKNGKTITLDLNGKTITGVDTATGSYGLITNKANLTVKGPGAIKLSATNDRDWNAYSSVISNTVGGNLTVEDGAVLEHLGGTDMAYGIDNLTNGKGTSAITTVNDATIKSTYRAIRQFLNGTEATNTLIVNADAVIEGANKSIWMQDPNTHANSGKLEVKEGAQLKGDVYLYVTPGSTEWPVSASIPASTLMDGSEVITGNVPTGYSVENVGGVWKVIAWTSVSTADELVAALVANQSVVFANDIKIDPANMSNAYGTTGINIKNGQSIDGNGKTLNIKGAGGTWDSGINTTGGLIKNLTVTGSFRGIFINHNSTYSEKVVLENVTITGTTYTISCDQGLYQGIEATNCTFNGWTSFAKTAGEAKFVNCSFGEGSGYKYCRPYSNTEFVNCTFCPGYAVDTTRATVTFTDCTWEE